MIHIDQATSYRLFNTCAVLLWLFIVNIKPHKRRAILVSLFSLVLVWLLPKEGQAFIVFVYTIVMYVVFTAPSSGFARRKWRTKFVRNGHGQHSDCDGQS